MKHIHVHLIVDPYILVSQSVIISCFVVDTSYCHICRGCPAEANCCQRWQGHIALVQPTVQGCKLSQFTMPVLYHCACS